MSLAHPQHLRNRYPEFCDVAEGVLQDFLDQANEEINEAEWGSRARSGELALAAHLLAIAGAAQQAQGVGVPSGVGPVNSVSVGDVSVSYGAVASNAVLGGLSPSLGSTKYGLEYSRLLLLTGTGASVL